MCHVTTFASTVTVLGCGAYSHDWYVLSVCLRFHVADPSARNVDWLGLGCCRHGGVRVGQKSGVDSPAAKKAAVLVSVVEATCSRPKNTLLASWPVYLLHYKFRRVFLVASFLIHGTSCIVISRLVSNSLFLARLRCMELSSSLAYFRWVSCVHSFPILHC